MPKTDTVICKKCKCKLLIKRCPTQWGMAGRYVCPNCSKKKKGGFRSEIKFILHCRYEIPKE